MLRMLQAIPDRGATWLYLPFEGLTTGFFVKDIQGLDPVRASMVSTSLGTIDGEQHQSSRRDKRNIVIKLGFDPTYGVISELRRELYAFFMPKENVRLRFYFDDAEDGHVEIAGKVESFEMPLFVKEPEATISILCYDPDFYVPTSTIFNGVTSAVGSDSIIEYPGTVKTGVVLRLSVNRTISMFQMFYRADGGQEKSLRYEGPVTSGQVVEISTVPGNKYVHLRSNGVATSTLYALTTGSSWTSLAPGRNYLRVFVEGTGIPYTVDYRVRYGGL